MEGRNRNTIRNCKKKNELQAGNITLTKGYKSQFTYFMRTIEYFEDYVETIHKVLNVILLQTIFGNESPLSEELI